MKFIAIAAVCENLGIGYKNEIPWKISDDLKRFKVLTIGHAVLMGRKTWDSLPRKPLENRCNIVVSKTPMPDRYDSMGNPRALFFTELHKAVSYLKNSSFEKVFVIGGQTIYEQTAHLFDELHITHIQGHHQCDTFFPAKVFEKFKAHTIGQIMQENELNYRYVNYVKI